MKTSGDLEQRVLVLTPSNPDAEEVREVLSESGISVRICSSMDELCSEIPRGVAACVVAEEALCGGARERLAAALAEPPSWSDLPLIVLASHPAGEDSRLHGMRDIGGTTQWIWLQRPLYAATLAGTVRLAVESRNRQYQVRAELAARQHAEDELKRLNEELERKVAERAAMAEQRALHLRRLAIQLSETEHHERSRLARLLHDDLQQLLSAIKLHLHRLIDTGPAQLKENLRDLAGWVDECLKTSRSLTLELSPPVLQYGTLQEIMDWLGKWFSEKYDLQVTTHADDGLPTVVEPVRLFLYQAVRELLMNVVKHSGNLVARILLGSRDGSLTVKVTDGGKGFDPEVVQATLQRPQGFGLFHIRERLAAFHGHLEIKRTQEGGANFELVVPLRGQDNSSTAKQDS